MAHSFNVNSVPATGALAIYSLLSTLLAATWTKPQDSDGTTYSSSGAQVTGGAAGTNGLANTSAWFVVRDPNSARSFSFQRGTTNLLWRVKYSRAAGFSGGSPAAAVTPSASDEVVLLGGGTNASPTYGTLLSADGSYRFNVCACDTTLGYSWYWHLFPAGDATGVQRGMFLDVMTTGSFPVGDIDPAVVFVPTNVSGTIFSGYFTEGLGYYGSPGGMANAWFGTVPDWRNVFAFSIAESTRSTMVAPVNTTGVHGCGTNAYSSKDDILPVPWGRTVNTALSPGGAPYGFKGFGQLFKMSTKFRANYDTLSVASASAKDYIWISGMVLPWNGSTPSI